MNFNCTSSLRLKYFRFLFNIQKFWFGQIMQKFPLNMQTTAQRSQFGKCGEIYEMFYIFSKVDLLWQFN